MKSKKQMLKDILMSAETNCVLKIKLHNVANPVITAVERVEKGRIILRPTCLYGYKLRKQTIRLPEIESITRYKTNFDSPLFAKLRFIKDNITAIRRDFEAFESQPMFKGA